MPWIILHYVSKELPFLVLLVLAVLRTQGAQYDLVAENLGASPWQRLRYVTLPLVLPALSAGAALVFALRKLADFVEYLSFWR